MEGFIRFLESISGGIYKDYKHLSMRFIEVILNNKTLLILNNTSLIENSIINNFIFKIFYRAQHTNEYLVPSVTGMTVCG